MSRFQIGLLVVLGVIATVAAGVFSQGAPTTPEAAPVAEEVAAPDAEAQAAEEAAAAAEAARIEAERLAAEAAAAAEAEAAWVVNAPLAGPELSVVRAGVGIYEDGSDEEAEPREIGEAEQAPVPVGGRVIVPGRGMAVLDWGGALRGELLRASSVTVEEGTLDDRRVALNQDDGTVRYLLSMPDEDGPVGMTVSAGPVTVSSDTSHGDMADLLITHVPDPEADDSDEGEDEDTADNEDETSDEDSGGRTWVVVIAGSAEIDFGGPVAAAGDAAGTRSVRLEAGQGAAFARGGEAPTVMPMDLVAVETWYGQMLSGYRDSIAAFAFRCVITADEVALRENPPASSGGQIQTSALNADNLSLAGLTSGALVNVTHRTEDGLWLEVDAPELEEPAWLEADSVECIAPVASVPIIDVAYLAPATATPAVVAVSFTGAETEIVAGKCTMLRWDVPVGSQISVDGQIMPGKGFQSVCPDRTTTYTLRWIDANGEPRERRVTIVVTEAPVEVAMADQGGDGSSEDGSGGIGGLLDPGDPEAEPTICIGPECEVVLPSPQPTRTRRPRPTKAPTEPAPIATDPPAATQPPAPTEPTSPDPTDPPEATATIGATATITATAPVTTTATATSTATVTATATDDPGPTGTPEPPTETPAAPTATLEPPTETPAAPDPDTPTPEPAPTETPAALRDGTVS